MFVCKYSCSSFQFVLQLWCLKDILIKLTGGSANNQSFIREEIQIKVIGENIWVTLHVTEKKKKKTLTKEKFKLTTTSATYLLYIHKYC